MILNNNHAILSENQVSGGVRGYGGTFSPQHVIISLSPYEITKQVCQ